MRGKSAPWAATAQVLLSLDQSTLKAASSLALTVCSSLYPLSSCGLVGQL